MVARAAAAFALVLAVLAAPAAAQPDETAQKKAAAEAAFRQGKALIDADTAGACAAFKQSMELDAQFGTQYNLALCYDKLGKLASAWGELTELAAKDTNAARRADAAKRAKALEPRLVRLLIVVKSRTPGLQIMRDESDVTAFMGVATPVDPGMSKLTASAPGYKPWTIDVTVAGEGSTITVEIPALEKLPEPPPDDDGKGKGVFQAATPPPPPPNPGRGRRITGLVLGGVGVASLGAGAFFGLAARSNFRDAQDECGGDVGDCRGNPSIAIDDVDRARRKAMISTIAFGVGAAALVGGAYLYLSAPRGETGATTVTPAFGEGTAGVVVRGRF